MMMQRMHMPSDGASTLRESPSAPAFLTSHNNLSNSVSRQKQTTKLLCYFK